LCTGGSQVTVPVTAGVAWLAGSSQLMRPVPIELGVPDGSLAGMRWVGVTAFGGSFEDSRLKGGAVFAGSSWAAGTVLRAGSENEHAVLWQRRLRQHEEAPQVS